MKLNDLFSQKRSSLSFEVFPPKTEDGYEGVSEAVKAIASLSPDYMSVTYGAGGTNAGMATSIATEIQRDFGVTSLAHFSCISSTKESVREHLETLKAHGIENILALRGDLPEGFDASHLEYRYAADLIAEIKSRGDFCVGGACYPEGHPESATLAADIEAIKYKVDAGCDFLVTQMFFDNNILYNYMYKLRDKGVDIPVVAGVMPVVTPKSIKRICAISGVALPSRFKMILDRYGDDPEAMKQAGIAYATEQIIDLYANGIRAVHVYAMNKPDVAAKIKENLSAIIKQ